MYKIPTLYSLYGPAPCQKKSKNLKKKKIFFFFTSVFEACSLHPRHPSGTKKSKKVAVPSSTSTREQPHAVPQVATSQAQPSRTHTESGYSNTTPALPVYTSSEAAHSHADTSEQPHVASQDSAYSADLLGGSQHAVPLPGATSVPSTDTPSESGYQSAPPALPNPVPVWNDIAPCPGFDLPIPETADEWEGLFYPTTTHFSSQGGDSMTAAEAFEYCGRWRTAVRPMLSQEELRKASTLCNRLRSLVQTRLRSAA